MSEFDHIFEGWESQGIKRVRFELPDLHGTSRTKIVPIGAVRGYARNGLNMYGGTAVLDTRSDVVPGSLYNEEVGYGDQLLFPDPTTAAIVPWAPQTARLICDARWYDGKTLEATPRAVYRRVLEKAHSMGYEPMTGCEFEFYLLDGETHERLFEGYHIFNVVRNEWVPTINNIVDLMPGIGIDIITGQLRVRRVAVGDQLHPGPGSGRSRQGLHVQERRQADRLPGGIPGHLHDQAMGGTFR